ncbi:MAG: hypothetical protein ACYC91_14130 [Solirubrobacteraceae bacterium]
MLPDLAGLLAALNHEQIHVIVIGAVAVGAHGHIRATQDLDVVPEPRHENLDRLADVLVALEARLVTDPRRGIDHELRHELYAGGNLTLTTRLGDLDVIQRLPGIPNWRALDAGARSTTLGGVPLRVCSLSHLLEMKRTRHSLQDRADIEALGTGRA